MAEHGGYRRPNNPAAVSGPGSLSQRTDGGVTAQQDLPNARYGEAAAFREIQGGAPMASGGGSAPAPLVPLTADTQRPDEPVTAGSPLGAGIGPQAAGIDTRTPEQQDASALRSQLPILEYMANSEGATPTMRALIRRLKGNQ